ncbi:DinB family protein [Gimibacter soli]|uniref:DinB family protein n=1 Tax=Gimibacter soli TaxID=3024400 RepID=A0AAF0BLH0_9PROT|nr:DinB family protein [Gimibacter soli]WCL55469.1 DinB family protein [Gimibacter soli]
MTLITSAYARQMAPYNAWQNASLVIAADGLTDEARKADRGAFFGSIAATLSHILWADQIWLSRFGTGEPPTAPGIADSTAAYPDWEAYKKKRAAMDEVAKDWAAMLDDDWLKGDLEWYSGLLKANITKPRALLVAHMFNHATHHRGQVHAMLTAAGARPDDTDLMLMTVVD